MTNPDWTNLARMAATRLDLPTMIGAPELTESQAFAALSWFSTATGGLRFSDSWPGTMGVRAYNWCRARAGSVARNTDGTQRLDDPRVAAMSEHLALHLDYLAPEYGPEDFVPDERYSLYLTELDVNGQYHSAAGGVQLGTGRGDLINAPRTIDAYLHMPGYLRLAARPADLQQLLPYSWRGFERLAAGRVITMNTAAFLRKRGVEMDADQVLIWPKSRAHLAAWATMWRGARAHLAPYALVNLGAKIALALVKEITNVTLGGWLRSEDKNHSELMNKSWSDAVITEAWVRALVSIERAGAAGAPTIGMRRDAAWFLGPRDQEPSGLTIDKTVHPTGRDGQLGKWKRTRCVPVTDSLCRAYATGSPEMLNKHLVAAVKDQALTPAQGQEQPDPTPTR